MLLVFHNAYIRTEWLDVTVHVTNEIKLLRSFFSFLNLVISNCSSSCKDLPHSPTVDDGTKIKGIPLYTIG